MNVEWVEKERPETNEWGMSKQLVLKTNKGAFATGYFNSEHGSWYCDGILFKEEVVIAWLRGL